MRDTFNRIYPDKYAVIFETNDPTRVLERVQDASASVLSPVHPPVLTEPGKTPEVSQSKKPVTKIRFRIARIPSATAAEKQIAAQAAKAIVRLLNNTSEDSDQPDDSSPCKKAENGFRSFDA